jgi:hypothetical protein
LEQENQVLNHKKEMLEKSTDANRKTIALLEGELYILNNMHPNEHANLFQPIKQVAPRHVEHMFNLFSNHFNDTIGLFGRPRYTTEMAKTKYIVNKLKNQRELFSHESL